MPREPETTDEQAEKMTRDDAACLTEQFGPGTFGCHEAMHMASVMAETVDERLCQHPAVMLNPAWEDLAQRACEALHELYQAIGQEHCK